MSRAVDWPEEIRDRLSVTDTLVSHFLATRFKALKCRHNSNVAYTSTFEGPRLPLPFRYLTRPSVSSAGEAPTLLVAALFVPWSVGIHIRTHPISRMGHGHFLHIE